ncbi:MAG: hypothetical protein J0L93_07620 [Deltaproteobacteria bacterium]|nr:hypothetical protein [Deltaproteobacteria bacterium]
MSQSSNKGFTEFSIGKIIIILLFVVGGWAAAHFAMGYFSNIQMQNTMTQAVLKNRSQNLNEEQWKDAIVAAVAAENQFHLDPKNLTVLQSEDKKKITIEVQYVRHIGITLFQKFWDLPFTAKVEENLNPGL